MTSLYQKQTSLDYIKSIQSENPPPTIGILIDALNIESFPFDVIKSSYYNSFKFMHEDDKEHLFRIILNEAIRKRFTGEADILYEIFELLNFGLDNGILIKTIV